MFASRSASTVPLNVAFSTVNVEFAVSVKGPPNVTLVAVTFPPSEIAEPLNVPTFASVIAPASTKSPAASVVRLSNACVPPTAPAKVVTPAVLTVSERPAMSPSTVLVKLITPAPVLVSVTPADAMSTASLYTWSPTVVMSLAMVIGPPPNVSVANAVVPPITPFTDVPVLVTVRSTPAPPAFTKPLNVIVPAVAASVESAVTTRSLSHV